jgi:hypothetical protein
MARTGTCMHGTCACGWQASGLVGQGVGEWDVFVWSEVEFKRKMGTSLLACRPGRMMETHTPDLIGTSPSCDCGPWRSGLRDKKDCKIW